MRTVFLRPERCVGCRQCLLGCAVAHSRSKTLLGALNEEVLSPPRIHLATGAHGEPFPNRCRHCDPAPCRMACFSGAIERDGATGTVKIEASRCIRCASCAMACPFGVIRFEVDPGGAGAPKQVALKCDNCIERLGQGRIPACVESCKTGALVFSDINEALQEKSREVSLKTTFGPTGTKSAEPTGFELLRALRAAMK